MMTSSTISIGCRRPDTAVPYAVAVGASRRASSARNGRGENEGTVPSFSLRFVDAVAPRVAVISVGADNRYRLPAAEVEARYRVRGTCTLRTDRCGAIMVAAQGARLDVQTMRRGCACATTLPW